MTSGQYDFHWQASSDLPLHAHGDAHAAADYQSVARPFFALRFCIREAASPARARQRPDRMADGDRAAIDIDLARVPTEVLVDRAGLGGKRFPLASMRSRSPTLHPAFLSAAREAAMRPLHDLRSTPACAHDTIRASGVLPSLAASLAFISTMAAAPSLIPEALAAVTVPSLSKAGRSLLMPSSVVPCFGYSSASTMISPLRLFHRHWDDFVLELPGLLRGFGLLLRMNGKLVLLLTGNLPLGATFSAALPM